LISNIFFQIHKHNAEYGEHKKVILRLKHPWRRVSSSDSEVDRYITENC
jgi:hypothetical protein